MSGQPEFLKFFFTKKTDFLDKKNVLYLIYLDKLNEPLAGGSHGKKGEMLCMLCITARFL